MEIRANRGGSILRDGRIRRRVCAGVTYLRHLSRHRWVRLKGLLFFVSLTPLLTIIGTPAPQMVWDILHGALRQRADLRNTEGGEAKKTEVEAEIKHLCLILCSSGESAAELDNSVDTFLRLREVVEGSGVTLSDFSGEDALNTHRAESQVRMVVIGPLSKLTALFDSLICLAEALEIVGWSVEKGDNSTESLRAEIKLARKPIQLGDICRELFRHAV